MTEGTRDLVSVVLPVFNRAALLQEAAASVLSQSHPAVELVIVDDGSTDETPQVAAELAERHLRRVRWVRQENAGAGAARNRGLTEARGDFIQYLDSDDLLLDEKLARQVAALKADPASGVAYCVAMRRQPDGTERPSHRTEERFDSILPDFLWRRGWPSCAPLWRRAACDRVGPWGHFRVMEDWEYDCRAGIAGIRPVFVPETLCIVRDHEGVRASGSSAGYDAAGWDSYLDAHESVLRRLGAAGLGGIVAQVPLDKSLFRVARACARHGFLTQAQRAYRLADDVTRRRVQRGKLLGFRVLASAVGWQRAAGLSELVWRLWRPANRAEGRGR